jgi:hypothetical protein
VPWRRTIPGLPQETPSGDGADLIDALLEDVKGVVAAGSFVPELLEFVPEPLGHFGVADERVGEPRRRVPYRRPFVAAMAWSTVW